MLKKEKDYTKLNDKDTQKKIKELKIRHNILLFQLNYYRGLSSPSRLAIS